MHIARVAAESSTSIYSEIKHRTKNIASHILPMLSPKFNPLSTDYNKTLIIPV